MLDEELSVELRGILKKGDFAGFTVLMEKEKFDASELLFAKRERSCRPLLNQVLNGAFSNRNYMGRLQIAHTLIEKDCDINDSRPDGFSPLTCLLREHYYLRTSKAKYEVFRHTLIFALEMVRQENIDVNRMDKECSGILDAAVLVWNYHEGAGNKELLHLASTLVRELVNKGALLEEPVPESWPAALDFLKSLEINTL